MQNRHCRVFPDGFISLFSSEIENVRLLRFWRDSCLRPAEGVF